MVRNDNFLMMSNTEMEVRTNQSYYKAANSGNYPVLLELGRGIGLSDNYLDFSKFKKRIIIEKYQEVIDSFPVTDDKSVIIKGDAFNLSELNLPQIDLVLNDTTEMGLLTNLNLSKKGLVINWTK